MGSSRSSAFASDGELTILDEKSEISFGPAAASTIADSARPLKVTVSALVPLRRITTPDELGVTGAGLNVIILSCLLPAAFLSEALSSQV